MTTIRVFDPAMCCSTGVCGPSVDPQLAHFAADLDWLATQGVSVERFNLAQQPAAFAEDQVVRAALETKGEAGLPLVKVNGEVKSSGVYPSRAELAAWAGVGASAPTVFTESVAELVAIGAAIASNCEPCFNFHYDKAKKLGISLDDVRQAATIAQKVKETPARAMFDLAARHLELGAAKPSVADVDSTVACCTPQAMPLEIKKSKCC